MAYGLITTRSLLVNFFEKKKDRPHIPFEKAHELLYAPPDRLKDREKKGKKIKLLQRIKARKMLNRKLIDSPRPLTVSPWAQAKERDYYASEAKTGATSELEKRCVSDVVKDGKTVSQAYAICRSSLQKSGRIKKGGMELTKLGQTISAVKAKKSDHAAKRASWKKAIIKARKG